MSGPKCSGVGCCSRLSCCVQPVSPAVTARICTPIGDGSNRVIWCDIDTADRTGQRRLRFARLKRLCNCPIRPKWASIFRGVPLSGSSAGTHGAHVQGSDMETSWRSLTQRRHPAMVLECQRRRICRVGQPTDLCFGATTSPPFTCLRPPETKRNFVPWCPPPSALLSLSHAINFTTRLVLFAMLALLPPRSAPLRDGQNR
jgi:hypothetical protein